LQELLYILRAVRNVQPAFPSCKSCFIDCWLCSMQRTLSIVDAVMKSG
jgi:hypothetical protein